MNTTSTGQLRQNPTAMIRAVTAGETCTLTDRGEPVAEIRPHPGPRWVEAEEVAALFRELGSDVEWLAELEASRAQEVVTDPWERHR